MAALKKISKLLVLAPTQKGVFQTFRKTHKNAKAQAAKTLKELEKLQARTIKAAKASIAQEAKDAAKAEREQKKAEVAQKKAEYAAAVAERKANRVSKNAAFHAFGKYWTIAKIESELDEKHWPAAVAEDSKRDWNKWGYEMLKKGGLGVEAKDLPEILNEHA